MKRILITGMNSYIGTSLEKWLVKEPERYIVDSISVKGSSWKNKSFSHYDVIIHVAAIVHKKQKHGMEDLYFKVNKELPIEVAKKAKKEGVSQFIFMSTMAVYGEEGKIGEDIIITPSTQVNPKNNYAISKVEAERYISKLNDDNFKIVIIRPPMVYGSNCPGNYALLEKVAVNCLIFPMIENKRSVLNIDNLCENIKQYIDDKSEGVFFPQDEEYLNTSLLVKELALKKGKKIYLSNILGLIIKLTSKKIKLSNKIFGNLVYEK